MLLNVHQSSTVLITCHLSEVTGRRHPSDTPIELKIRGEHTVYLVQITIGICVSQCSCCIMDYRCGQYPENTPRRANRVMVITTIEGLNEVHADIKSTDLLIYHEAREVHEDKP
jgi:hypothetical protein